MDFIVLESFQLYFLVTRDVLFEFHLKFWNTAINGIPVLEVYYKVDRLLTGLTAQWYSNKTSLHYF